MGYAMAFGRCIGCKKVFGYNPLRVPSTSAITGEREPICRACMDDANTARKAAGLAPIPIAADAYEAVDANEIE